MTDLGHGPYQLLPPLTPDEYEALRDNIAIFGLLHPVVMDESGNVIDGHHRHRACVELGITDFPTVTLPGLSEDQKLEQALMLNLGRRHLCPTANESPRKIRNRPQGASRDGQAS